MTKQRVLSLNTLRQKQFKTFAFDGQWLEWFGAIETNTKFLFYGPSGSGKSTFVLRLCDYLARFGKVGYNSWEEGISKTFQQRVIAQGVKHLDRIFLLDKFSVDEMLTDTFKRKRYRHIVIDSTNFMNLTKDQYQALVDKYPGKVFIFIAQVNGKGNVKGGTDLLHAVDVKVRCINGRAKIQSRFTTEKTIEIFNPAHSTHQGQTFTIDFQQ
jgi:predicted ATP-dependent serine protease